jgi:transcriptional regulator with XRE-family HTH domain
MPRMSKPTELTTTIAERIRKLREEYGMTQEGLANASDMSKGHLSNIERGLVNLTSSTADKLAKGFELEIFDLFTFPERNGRHKLTDLGRRLTRGTIRKTNKEWELLPPPKKKASGPKRQRTRASGKKRSKGV